MWKIIKKLNPWAVMAAIALLFVQIVCDLYIPTLMTEIVNGGIATGNTALIWNKGVIMIVLSIVSLGGAVGNVFISAKIVYRLGCVLRVGKHFCGA